MKARMMAVLGLAAVLLSAAGMASADSFGIGANRFDMDFVTISGATNPASGSGIVGNDYRIGTFEITNAQWNKFKASLGVPVTGTPSFAYDENSYWTGANLPTNMVSWYEAAQFVNWLNTSTGRHAAYKFTGTQGASDYAPAAWSAAEADGSNLLRHKDAFYYLPTEDEWLKAAYWNGTTLQTYATKNGLLPVARVDANYNYVDPHEPWNVGSGSQELNGTYDMMGNVWEWMESPWTSGDYGTGSARRLRGGSFYNGDNYLQPPNPNYEAPNVEWDSVGFRVASEVPEPAIVLLLASGGLAILKRKRS
jgi:formylglycine-generating enzyme required for sulfatase activity